MNTSNEYTLAWARQFNPDNFFFPSVWMNFREGPSNRVCVSGMRAIPSLIFLVSCALIPADCYANPDLVNTVTSGPRIGIFNDQFDLRRAGVASNRGEIFNKDNVPENVFSTDEVSNRSKRSPPFHRTQTRFAPRPPYRGPRHPREMRHPIPPWYVAMPNRYRRARFPVPMPPHRRAEDLEAMARMFSKRQTFCAAGPPCTCKERMALVGNLTLRDVSRGCDGFCDCPECEDETGCATTPLRRGQLQVSSECPAGISTCVQCTSDQRYCARGGTNKDISCFSKEQECDGKFDCRFSWKDEIDCVKLDEPCPSKPAAYPVAPEGVVFMKFRGNWHAVCVEGEGAPVSNLAASACQFTLGQLQSGEPTVTSVTPACMAGRPPFLKFRNGAWEVQNTCSGSFIQVKCAAPTCGNRLPTRHRMDDDMTFVQEILQSLTRNTRNAPKFARRVRAGAADKDGARGTDDRIVGGEQSFEMKNPWTVHLAITVPDGTETSCTGFILNEFWVGTAAHCLAALKDKNGAPVNQRDGHIQVTAGTVRLTSASPFAQIRTGALGIIHENYSTSVEGNDIALIKVDTRFLFNPYVNSVCLPSSANQSAPAGWFCEAAGWGRLKEGGIFPDHLQEVSLPIAATCNEQPKVNANKDKLFCAGPIEGGKDTCQGDSGGALVCSYQGLPPLVEGVASVREGCARPNARGVYTRVSAHASWISLTFSKDVAGAFNDPKYRLAPCPGRICDRGRCVSTKRQCNGIYDCPETGEDEPTGCRPARKRFSPFL